MTNGIEDTPAPGGARPAQIDDVRATVLSNLTVNDTYRHLVLQAPGPASEAQAGQFFNMACSNRVFEDPLLRRPMSVYRADANTGIVEFLYKVAGVGTRALALLEPGQKIWILGPLGKGFSVKPDWNHVVLLGRGVGLATLAPLAELASASHVSVTVILSARSPAGIMSVKRFAQAGARVHTVIDSDGSSSPQNVERILRGLVRDPGVDAFFTCGSSRLMLLVQRLGHELGIEGQVALEQQMACGLGMCFCCVRYFKSRGIVESRRVCVQGPVFKLEEVMPWT